MNWLRSAKIESVRILAIESSCDETAAAVVEDGERDPLRRWSPRRWSRTASTAAWCRSWPRANTCARSSRWCGRRCARSGTKLDDLAAIAVTVGPGLVGSLLVGLTYAKIAGFASGVPLIGVNHIEGHIHAVILEARRDGTPVELPALALVVSGGHTHLFEVPRGLSLPPARQDPRRCRRRGLRQGRQAARLRLSGRTGDRPAGAPRQSARGEVHASPR